MEGHRSVLFIAFVVSTLILVFCIGTAQALSNKDLSIYIPFDGILNAAYANGDPTAQVAGEVEFTPGVSGSAVVINPGTALSYSAKDHVNRKQGSISIWVKTYEQPGNDSFSLLTIPGRMLFGYYGPSVWMQFLWHDEGGNSGVVGYPVPAFYYHQQKWDHFVITWDETGKHTRYCNGKWELGSDGSVYDWLKDERPAKILDGDRLVIGGNKKIAVDELMIFNRAIDETEVKNLYRHGKATLPETAARIGNIETPPAIDGIFTENEWANTAEVCDFLDRPFGNLSMCPVRANIAYDNDALYIAVRSEDVSADGSTEIWLTAKSKEIPYRFVVGADGESSQYRGTDVLADSAWRTAVGSTKATMKTFEAAIPWKTIGVGSPVKRTQIYLNIIHRWSGNYGGVASWTDITPATAFEHTDKYARITLGGDKPVFRMYNLGKLNYAQLNLNAEVVGRADSKQTITAEVRLQPSDLKEIIDPETYIRTYTGNQLNLDRDIDSSGIMSGLRVEQSFSDVDMNSLHLKVSDSNDEIIYQAQRSFIPHPPVTSIVELYPNSNRALVIADVSNYREGSLEELKAVIQLMDASGNMLDAANISTFDSSIEKVDFDLSKLPVGAVNIRTTLTHGAREVSTFDTSFDKLAPGPWVGNNMGRDEIVIPPFTSVKVNGQSVSVWERTYTWKNSLFPVQITSLGEDLLAAPIELVHGYPTDKPNPAEVRLIEHSDTRAVIECKGKLGMAQVIARHTIEFDGMCLTQLELSSDSIIPLNTLSLYIPFKEKQSTLYHYWAKSGAVRETENLRSAPMNGKANIPFTPAFWLGNEYRGMTWFAESPKGWETEENANPIGVLAETDRTSLTIRFAGKPFDLDKTLSLTFGVIATPVKPMPENWRTFRVWRDYVYTWNHSGQFTNSNNDIRNPNTTYKDYLSQQRRTVPMVIPYQRPDWMNMKEPECTYYRQEWTMLPFYISGSDDTNVADKHLSVCLASEWQDFMLYYGVKAFHDIGMDGYYFDGGLPTACMNENHGCGWIGEDGKLYASYPLLAFREFYKRLATEFYKSGRPYIIKIHNSNLLEMPTCSFVSFVWDGEQFSTSVQKSGGYTNLMTLEQFRAEFLGQQFGIPVHWLGYTKTESEADTLLAFSLSHGTADTGIAGSGPVEHIHKALNAQDSFGIRQPDAEFIGYWENKAYISRIEPADDKLICSLWKRPNKALLVLANVRESTRNITITLNTNSLGLSGNISAKDLITGNTLDTKGESVKLDIPASGWRLVEISD